MGSQWGDRFLDVHTSAFANVAPEMYSHGELSGASDVYSFGVLVWQVRLKRRAFAVLMHGHLARQTWLVQDSSRTPTSPSGQP